MTKALRFLTETPERRAELLPLPRDILSDLLRSIRFSGAINLRTELSAPWLIQSLPHSDFAAALQAQTKHILPFHIVANGNCWVQAMDDTRKFLSQGDIIIFPHGDSHILGDRLDREPVLVSQLLPEPPWTEPLILKYGGGGEVTQLVCGFLQCEELLLYPFLKTLPTLMHVRAFAEPTAPLLEAGVRYIIQETDCFQSGSMCSLTRLVELMFIEILRNYMQNLPTQQIGLLSALKDPIISQVLERIHADPAYPWTVSALAAQLSISRSALAARFTQLLGQPPMKYLTYWRLQLASQQLQYSDSSIAKIASQVGYESEAAFNRAFKRHVGMPPGVWRDGQRPAFSPSIDISDILY
jgi:AraC family transcriptional regulator, alkane utilization regulator